MPISAVYRKGVIKPLVEVDLKENEKIEIEIKRKKSDPVDNLLGIIKIKDPNVKELIASEEWY
ncbi:MAG: antitoxin family protein [Candidatus Hydrothermarchaeota archaeon]|nr:antitoxin family protein [Candidatus Hydrothermarchaeota archaeon]